MAPYGAKVHWSHLVYLTTTTHTGNRSDNIDVLSGRLLDTIFPGARHIWLSRQDKLRQAISLVRAQVSGVWWQLDAKRIDGTTLQYPTSAAVEAAVRVLEAQDEAWRQYFDRRDLKPLHVYYEDIIDAYDRSVRYILQYLGTSLPPAHAVPRPRFRRQADEWSERLLRRIITHTDTEGYAVE